MLSLLLVAFQETGNKADKFASMDGLGLRYFFLFTTPCAISVLENASVMLLAAYCNFGS